MRSGGLAFGVGRAEPVRGRLGLEGRFCLNGHRLPVGRSVARGSAEKVDTPGPTSKQSRTEDDVQHVQRSGSSHDLRHSFVRGEAATNPYAGPLGGLAGWPIGIRHDDRSKIMNSSAFSCGVNGCIAHWSGTIPPVIVFLNWG